MSRYGEKVVEVDVDEANLYVHKGHGVVRETLPDRLCAEVSPRRGFPAVPRRAARRISFRQIIIPANTKQWYNICTMLDQRQRRLTDVVQMHYECFVFAGISRFDLAHDEFAE